eukprot:GHVH01011141.1.p1 GENE.GHVH01011141.1~~GHVH01011141.1.p1  ORF type:complete len:658 (+),score=69.21 GHVH01011141.1:156-2129(+)
MEKSHDEEDRISEDNIDKQRSTQCAGSIDIGGINLPQKAPQKCKCMIVDEGTVRRSYGAQDENECLKNDDDEKAAVPSGSKYIEEIIERVLHTPPVYAEYLLEHDDNYLTGLFSWHTVDIIRHFWRFHPTRLVGFLTMIYSTIVFLVQVIIHYRCDSACGGLIKLLTLIRNTAILAAVYNVRVGLLYNPLSALLKSFLQFIDEKLPRHPAINRVSCAIQTVTMAARFRPPEAGKLAMYQGKNILVLGGASVQGRAFIAEIAYSMMTASATSSEPPSGKIIVTYSSDNDSRQFCQYLEVFYKKKLSVSVAVGDDLRKRPPNEFHHFLKQITLIRFNGLDMTRVVHFCKQIEVNFTHVDLLLDLLPISTIEDRRTATSPKDLIDGWLEHNFMKDILTPFIVIKRLLPLLARGSFPSSDLWTPLTGAVVSVVSSDIALFGNRGPRPFVNYRQYLHGLVISALEQESVCNSVINQAVSASRCHFTDYMIHTREEHEVQFGIVVLDVSTADDGSPGVDHLFSSYLPHDGEDGEMVSRLLINTLYQGFSPSRFIRVPAVSNYSKITLDKQVSSSVLGSGGLLQRSDNGYQPPPLMMSVTLGMELNDLLQFLLLGFSHILEEEVDGCSGEGEAHRGETSPSGVQFVQFYNHYNLDVVDDSTHAA